MALIIDCPICGKRSGYEFRFGGEEKGIRPDGPEPSPAEYAAGVHLNRCVAGIQTEWWFHRDGCGLWFRIDRDTTTNRQVRPVSVDREETL